MFIFGWTILLQPMSLSIKQSGGTMFSFLHQVAQVQQKCTFRMHKLQQDLKKKLCYLAMQLSYVSLTQIWRWISCTCAFLTNNKHKRVHMDHRKYFTREGYKNHYTGFIKHLTSNKIDYETSKTTISNNIQWFVFRGEVGLSTVVH